MITVIAAIIHHEDQILIARRAAHKSQAGYWEFPGGKLEAGETAEVCLVREIQEELNISISAGRYFCTSVHDYGSFQIELQAYHCTYLGGQISLSDHDVFAWITKNDFKNFSWAPADLPIVTQLQSSFS